MKLLFYNHTPIISGAERVLLLILSRLDPREFNCVVLCPRGALQEQLAATGVPCHPVESLDARFTWRLDLLWRYLRSFVQTILSVRRQVKTLAPDLIHANSIRAGLVMTAATAGLRVPVIWHLHDLLPHHPLSTAIRLFTLSSSRLRLLAVSQATARRFYGLLLRPFTWRVPVTTIHNCADTEKFQPNQQLRAATRTAFGLHETTFVVGLIGQITERKGQLGLLQAFAQVLQELPAAELWLVGEPLFTAADQQYYEHLRQTAAELGIAAQVRLLGARRDVPALLQAMDVLVVNSLAEPCGLVVLEGMASGLPVVVTAVGGNPELVHHGFSGWWVPVADEPALVEALLMMQQLPTLRERLAQNARLRVQQFFTVETYMTAVRDFYLTSVPAAQPAQPPLRTDATTAPVPD